MSDSDLTRAKAIAALKGTVEAPKGKPLSYVRMRCRVCDVPIPAGDKDKDPLNYARVGLPMGVEYNPKVHFPVECVDCAMESRREVEEAEQQRELDSLYAAMEREHFGVMSEETIKREVSAGRLSPADGLFEFMALMKTGTSGGERVGG